MTSLTPRQLRRRLLLVTLLLIGLGLGMVYSASSVVADSRFHDGDLFLRRQAIRAVLGIMALLAIGRTDYRGWAGRSKPLLLVCWGLLLLCVLPGMEALTPVIKGARRWIVLGGATLQPSEFAKIGMVLWGAAVLPRKGESLQHFSRGLLPVLVGLGGMAVLVALEKDLGSAVFLFLMLLILLFLAGARVRDLALLCLIGSLLVVVYASLDPERWSRFRAYVRPTEGHQDINYQGRQSLIALGSGGLTGVGPGAGRQKFFFLPEPYTDSIFAVLGEEIGLIGTLLALGLYGYLGFLGFTIAGRAPDPFGRLLGTGMTTLVLLAAALNMAVVLGLTPTTGVPLPFVSYGGTALLSACLAVGFLVSLARAEAG